MNKDKSQKLISWLEDKEQILNWNLSSKILKELRDVDVKQYRITITPLKESINPLGQIDSKKLNKIKKLQSIDENQLGGFFECKGSISKFKL